MKKLLITAFEPFGGKGYNPSSAMIDEIKEDRYTVKRLLPTCYAGAARALKKALEEEKPDVVILTGQASGRTEVCLEFCALNIKDASIADNDGEKATGESIVSGAPNALFTNLDLAHAVKRICEEDLPCRVSYHAGTFVCNSTYYHLLFSGTPGVFMHIPDDERSKPKEGAPFMPLNSSVKALTILMQVLREKS